MLAKRIIPCLDVKNKKVVKGVKFLNLKDAGNPIEVAKVYEKEGADELVFLDISASSQKRKTMLQLVKDTAKEVFMPFTVGGGISCLEDIRRLLLAGADKVSINTAAVKNPKLIKEASRRFGSQCIVVAIDAKRKSSSFWEVYIYAGSKPTGLNAIEWARQAEDLGAGEILLTSMDCDGTTKGYDIALNKAISSAVNIPVIASGGAGRAWHFYEVFHKTQVSAALAASVFHYQKISIPRLKEYLKNKGIVVRL